MTCPPLPTGPAYHSAIGADPTLVAVAGDWHGNTAWAIHVVHQAARCGVNVIVQVGDFGLWPGKWGTEYLDELNLALDDAGVALLWVDGNHDDHDQLAKWPLADGVHRIREHITHLPRGYRWHWHGKVWLALGGAVSIDRADRIPTRTWWWGEVITEADAERCTAGGRADMMITHDAPAGVGALDGWLGVNGFRLAPELQADADRSRELVRQVVDGVQPELLVHGHYHYRYSDRVGPTRIEGLNCDGTDMKLNLLRIDPATLEVLS
ncbi:metallophosphoesterase family protein [Tsukamurella paurometabola]|uniref:Metallophosphoesterase family protein n=1 Tax=Tsukamurella paurometabola TaxID=2061 RepID=A0ABS5NH71_TSUPA|nr:metallophosphoesterase [Tsukamurella paurometabola]MBS4102773.1 metallophosphoesterase family protein [Tsukamurella paurometabola]